MDYPHDWDDSNDGDNFDHPSSKAHYADTPLRMLALAEVSQPAFAEIGQRGDTLEDNLALLERLVPPQCADLETAHAYLEPTMRDVRRRLPVAEWTCAHWEQESDGREFPLIGKVAFIAILDPGGKQTRSVAKDGGD